MSYDHWKSTNPADEQLGPEPDEEDEESLPMSARTPNDGKPYYCEKCGAGLGEYIACEWPDCELETDDMAKTRLRPAQPAPSAPERRSGDGACVGTTSKESE